MPSFEELQAQLNGGIPTSPQPVTWTPDARSERVRNLLASGGRIQDTDQIGGSGSGWRPPEEWSQAIENQSQKSDDGGGFGWSDISSGFGQFIDIIDTPRAFTVSGINELIDLTGQNGGQASWSEFMDQGWDNMGFRELMENRDAFTTERGYPGFVGASIGFIGDVVSDPLTYVGVGAVRHGFRGGIKGIDALVTAARAGDTRAAAELAQVQLRQGIRDGSRRHLSETVTELGRRVTKEGDDLYRPDLVAQGLTRDMFDDVVRVTGQRGNAAFTSRYASGYDQRVIDALGIKGRMHGVKAGGVALPGTAKVGEAAANLNGSLKAWMGNSRAAQRWRNKFVGDNETFFGQAERQFMNELLTGAGDPARAARGLVALRRAKGVSWDWHASKAAATSGKKGKFPASRFKNLTDDQISELGDIIESGAFREGSGEFNDLATDLYHWYNDIGNELRDVYDVDFNWQSNYVNHMMTDQAIRAARSGDQRLVRAGVNPDEMFQQTRTLRQGDSFLGERIPVIDEGASATIKQLNEISNRVLGYDMFESDIRMQMSAYLAQAQRAIHKSEIARALDDMGEGINKEVLAAVKEVDEAAKDMVGELADQGRAVHKARKAIQKRAKDLETEATGKLHALNDASTALGRVRGALAGNQAALQFWETAAESGSKAARDTARRKTAELRRRIGKLETQAAAAERRLAKAESLVEKSQVRAQMKEVAAEQRSLNSQLDSLTEATSQVDQWAKTGSAKQFDARVADEMRKASRRVNEAQKRYITRSNNVAELSADSAVLGLLADKETQYSMLSNLINDADDFLAKFPTGKGRGKASARKTLKQLDTVQLREQADVLRRVFDEAGDDQAVKLLADVEASYLSAAGKAFDGFKGSDIGKAIGSIDDPKFQQMMTDILESGFAQMNRTVALPDYYQQALNKVPQNPRQWSEMSKVVQAYDRAMNWWKGLATTSPGFVIRNLYGGMFSMYLDGVNPNNVRRFAGMFKRFNSLGADITNPETQKAMRKYMAKRFGDRADEEYDNFVGALEAAAGSGWGLNPQEVSTQLVGAKRSLNPFNVEFAPTKAIRDLSTRAEAYMRGTHAYDVLKRTGGDRLTANRHVEMFHFNYRDISEFDRMAKRVVPFWTFFSRNMALQSQVWSKMPQKLNRSYFNLKRNMEYMSEEDDVVPGWFEELGAIRTPFGEPNGGRVYFTPDLPSLRFREDFQKLTGLDDEGNFDPLRALSDTSPFIKVPVEMLDNRELFTGSDYRNRLYDFDEDGNTVARSAPHLLQLAGVKQAADLVFGDNAEIVNGELVWQDNVESAVEDLFPLLGRTERLVPNSPKFSQDERHMQSILSFLGVPTRVNTERNIEGELYAREKRARGAAEAEALRQMLEGLD